jgi:hypothetical protein
VVTVSPAPSAWAPIRRGTSPGGATLDRVHRVAADLGEQPRAEQPDRAERGAAPRARPDHLACLGLAFRHLDVTATTASGKLTH